MSIPATEVEARWNAAAEPFTAVVREVRDWDAATPCEGWDALDLLDHVIAGQRDFAARQGREVPSSTGPASSWPPSGPSTPPPCPPSPVTRSSSCGP